MALTTYDVSSPTPSAANSTSMAGAVMAPVPVGDVVYVALGLGAASPATGVSDNKGNTWSKLASSAATTTAQTVELWFTVITTALTTADTITVTRAPTGGILWHARAVHGADTTAPFGMPVTAAASSTGTPTGALVTVPGGGLGLMAFSYQTNVTISALNAGWTGVYNDKSTGAGNPRALVVAEATETATPGASSSVAGIWAMITVHVNPASTVADERTATGVLTISGQGVVEVAPPVPADARVAIIGDSLTYRSGITASPPSRESITRGRFVAAGFDDAHLFWHGVGGKGIVASDTSGKTTMQNITDAVTALGSVDVWVIALGTNNTGDSDATFNTNIGTVLSAITSVGGGIILWVNLGYWSPVNTNAVRFNPIIAAAVDTVLDFNAHMGNPRTAGDWIYPTDSTHLTPQGSESRDWFIIDGVLAALDETPSRTAAGVLELTGGAVAAVPVTGGGVLVSGGAAVVVVREGRTAIGEFALTGMAVARGVSTGMGTLSLTGTATASTSEARTATGMLELTGSADAEPSAGAPARTATGTLTLQGSATAMARVTAVGVLALGVTAPAFGRHPRTAQGMLTLAVIVTAVALDVRTSNGVLTLSGVGVTGGMPPIPDTRTLTGARTSRVLDGAGKTRTLAGHAPTRRLEGTS